MNKTNFPEQVKQAVSITAELLGDQVLGIYLYGSAALDGLRPSSDIDLLVITDREIADGVRMDFTKQLMAISGAVGCIQKRPLEVTVISQKSIIPWNAPPRCEYMYGEWLREEMEAGYIPQPCYDADVTILLWQAREHNIHVKGEHAEQLIPTIPFSEVQKAIQDSLPGLLASIKGDERNVLLTLSRMWFTLETAAVCSKATAAEWAMPKLPHHLVPLMESARNGYCGESIDEWGDKQAETSLLADFLKKEIISRLPHRS